MDRKERIEENEKLFREVNERVERLEATFQSGPDPEWVCECGDETCFEKLSVPLADYHDVRTHDSWFLIRPGHEQLDIERILDRRSAFYVVQKDGV